MVDYDKELYGTPGIATDVVLLTIKHGQLHVLLIERDDEPEKGKWALPGVFVQANESVACAAKRALHDKAHIKDLYLEQLYTFGEPHRDPRGRILSVAYFALVPAEKLASLPTKGQVNLLAPVHVAWSGEMGGPVSVKGLSGKELQLAFDHSEIIGSAVKRLRGKLRYTQVAFGLLPKRFTMRELQETYQIILDKELNKDSFRRKIIASDMVLGTGEKEADTAYRPAELFVMNEQWEPDA